MKKVYLILLWIWLAFTAMAQQSSVFQGTYNSGQHTIYHSSLVTDNVNPTAVSQDAKVELRAATSIRLLPGFRAGGFTPGNGGYFLASIGLGGSRKDTAICKGQQIQLGDSAELNVSYAWSPSIGLNDTTLSNPLANPDSTTMYLLLKTYPNGRVEIDTVVVVVNPLPVADAGSDVAFCAGGSVGLSASASGGTPSYSFAWSPATGLSSATVSNPTASPTVNTTYTLVVTDSLGCNHGNEVDVNVFISGESCLCPNNLSSISDSTIILNSEISDTIEVWAKITIPDSAYFAIYFTPFSDTLMFDVLEALVYTSCNDTNPFYVFEPDSFEPVVGFVFDSTSRGDDFLVKLRIITELGQKLRIQQNGFAKRGMPPLTCPIIINPDFSYTSAPPTSLILQNAFASPSVNVNSWGSALGTPDIQLSLSFPNPPYARFAGCYGSTCNECDENRSEGIFQNITNNFTPSPTQEAFILFNLQVGQKNVCAQSNGLDEMVIRLNTNVVPQISGNISTFNSLSQSVGEVVIPGPFSNNNWTGASSCVHLSPEQAQGFKFVTIYPRENQNGTDNYQMNAYLNNFQMTSLLIEGLPLEPLAFNCGISLPVELTTEFCGIEIGLGATTVRYTWIDVDGTTVISGADDPNPTTYFPSQSGVCTLRVEFYQFNQLVCFSDRHIEIIVNPEILTSISGLNSQYCLSLTPVALTGTPAGGTFFGVGVTGNIFTPSVTGTHTITYTLSNANGCYGQSTQQVSVSNLPLPTAIIQGSEDYCTSIPNIYTATGADYYIWTLNTNPLFVSQSLTFQYGGISSFPVDLSVVGYNLDGCPGAPYTFTIQEGVSGPPVSGFTTDPMTTCYGSNGVSFFDQSTSAGNYATYLWDFGDGTTSTQQNPTHQFPSPGYYSVRLYVTNACGEDNYGETVYISPDCCELSYVYDRTTDYHVYGFEVWATNINSEPPFQSMSATIYVHPGAALIIGSSGGPIRFGPNGKIIVMNGIHQQPGGKLTLNLCTLTSIENGCNTMWQGIEVHGNGLVDQEGGNLAEHGKINFGEGECRIENAHIGILAGYRNNCIPSTPSYLPPNILVPNCNGLIPFISQSYYAGGIINSFYGGANSSWGYCSFTHNAIDIKMDPYPYRNHSNIVNCRFNGGSLLDPGYNLSNTYHYPNSQNPTYPPANDQQRTTTGIYVNGCNLVPGPTDYYLGGGIPNASISFNIFKDMETGVRSVDSRFNFNYNKFNESSNGNPTNTFCDYGMVVANTNQSLSFIHDISYNDFYRIRNNALGYQLYSGSLMLASSGCEGISYNKFGYDNGNNINTQNQNCFGIRNNNGMILGISSNEFNYTPFGILSTNNGGYIFAGPSNGTNLGNNFLNNCFGFIGFGDNSSTYIKCNDFTHNLNNTNSYFRNWHDDGPLANQGSYIGNNDKLPAGNRFNVVGKKHIYKTATTISGSINNQTIYYHHEGSATSNLVPTVTGVTNNRMVNFNTHLQFNSSSSCQKSSMFGLVAPSNPLQYYRDMEAQTDSLEDLWENIILNIDSGQTTVLLADLKDTLINDSVLTVSLISKSPLSDTVISGLFEYRPMLDGVLFQRIMLPNLPLDQNLNESFFKFCNNYPDSLMDTLRALAYYNPYYNTLTKVKIDIMASKNQCRQMASEFIQEFLTLDSLKLAMNFMDSINDNSFERVLPLVSTYLGIDSLEKSSNILERFNPTSQSEEDWKTFMEIRLSLLHDSLSWFEMDSTQNAFINTLAHKSYPYSIVTTLAQNVRRLVFNEDFCDSMNIAFPFSEERLEEIIQNNDGEKYSYSSNLYPNPAKDRAMLEYSLQEKEYGVLELFNILGEKILSINLLPEYTKISIDISTLTQGIYIYRAYTPSRKLSSGKLIISK